MSYDPSYYREYKKKYPKGTPNTVPKNCEHCKKEYQVPKYRFQISRFCSISCSLFGTQRAGDGSKSNEREKWQGSKALKDWRKAVFSRDRYTCQECGSTTKRLNADHIKPWAYFPELRADINNGRTLCVDCHKQTPTYGSRAKTLALQGAY